MTEERKKDRDPRVDDRKASSDSPAGPAPDAAVRDLARGVSGGVRDGAHGRRRGNAAPVLFAVLSLALVLGSAGYFALNPDSLAGQASWLAYPEDGDAAGDGREVPLDPQGDGAQVDPGSRPVGEEAPSGSGGESGRKGDGSSAAAQGSQGGASGQEGAGAAHDGKPSGSKPGSNPDAGEPSGDGGSSGVKPGAGSGGGSAGGKPGSSQQGGQNGGGTTAPAPKTVTVSISVDSSAADGSVSSSGTFTFNEGATVYDALCALGLSIGSRQSAYGVYVSSIGGLAEKQFGASSGWMYAVNGSFPSVACSAYTLKDGDSIQWRYVTG